MLRAAMLKDSAVLARCPGVVSGTGRPTFGPRRAAGTLARRRPPPAGGRPTSVLAVPSLCAAALAGLAASRRARGRGDRGQMLARCAVSVAESRPAGTGPPLAPDAGLLLLEHLNLNVLSTEVSMLFYEALGCVRDERRPMNKTLHMNSGALTQFHTPSPTNEVYISNAGPQKWRGDIQLLYEDLASIEQAADRVRALQSQTLFANSQLSVEGSGDGTKVIGPYGNSFTLHVVKPRRLNLLGPDSGQRPGSERARMVGLGAVSLRVPVGTAAAGARFYQEVLGFATRERGPGQWTVLGGPGESQELLLVETEGADGRELGEHVAIYIGDYEGCFERLLARGLIWINPRFEHLDSSGTLQEAVNYNCFRFKDVVDLDSGRKLFELEHEVRSVKHKSCPLAK